MDLCLPRRFVRKWTNRTHPKFELDSPNSFSVTLLTQFMILLSHSDIYCNHIATHLSRIEKICLIWNKFLFLPIKFILHFLQGLVVAYQANLRWLSCIIQQALRWKCFRRSLQFGFHWRKLSSFKRFAAIEKVINRLVQGHMNMWSEIQQTNWVSKLFAALCGFALS